MSLPLARPAQICADRANGNDMQGMPTIEGVLLRSGISGARSLGTHLGSRSGRIVARWSAYGHEGALVGAHMLANNPEGPSRMSSTRIRASSTIAVAPPTSRPIVPCLPLYPSPIPRSLYISRLWYV